MLALLFARATPEENLVSLVRYVYALLVLLADMMNWLQKKNALENGFENSISLP